jgi:hypothetical protein
MDASTDAGVDGRWMSYAELAELRHIDKPSALKLALRRKWERRKDNHGTMQVCVPTEWLQSASRVRDVGTDAGVDASIAIQVIQEQAEAARAAYQVALEAKDGELVALRSVIGDLRSTIARTEDRAAAAEARAAAERVRADGLADKLAEEQARADRAERAAEEAARIAQPETGARAADLEHALAETTRRLDTAEAIAERAHAAAKETAKRADELRRADDARPARGSLRRIWAAWRGE